VTELAVDVLGDGDTVVLVHGSGRRDGAWPEQLELAGRYRLVLPYRRGYPPSPEADPDFEADARDIVSLLEEPAHVVGHSYGGVASLVAAGLRPEDFRSVAVIEPPAFGIVRGQPEVEELIVRLEGAFRVDDPEEFDRAFYAALGLQRSYDRLDAETLPVAEARRRERMPWEAEIPFERLDGIPVLVVSGDWNPAFEAVCDVLEERLGAERAVFRGHGHVPQDAPGFNERLVSFWGRAARPPADRP
jgi:pimeloyl-ACP methyl ester carboxylesterase